METIGVVLFCMAFPGLVLFVCVLVVAHFTQVTARQLRQINAKMDDILTVVRRPRQPAPEQPPIKVLKVVQAPIPTEPGPEVMAPGSVPCPKCGKGIPEKMMTPGLNTCPYCGQAYEVEDG